MVRFGPEIRKEELDKNNYIVHPVKTNLEVRNELHKKRNDFKKRTFINLIY